MSSPSRPLLTEEDASALYQAGLLTPSPEPGNTTVLRIHKRRLHRSSDEEHSAISISDRSSHAFFNIPQDFPSLAAVEYCGFTASRAADIWSRWDPPSRAFSDFMQDCVTGPDAAGPDVAQWRRCLNHHGISDDLQSAILDQDHTELRLRHTCIYWIRYAIGLRFRALEGVRKASNDRTQQHRRKRQAQQSSSGAPPQPSSSRTASGMQREGSSIIVTQNLNELRQRSSTKLPGHIALYKAVDQGRTEGLVDSRGNLNDIRVLMSTGPGDFNPFGGLYFTPDFGLAEKFASYAKRLSLQSSVVIVKIHVLQSAIDGLTDPQKIEFYFPDPLWKKMVWTCRAGGRRRAPPEVVSISNNATLIIGTCAGRNNQVFSNIGSWEEVDALHLERTVAGRNGVQYFFSAFNGSDFLEQSMHKSDLEFFAWNDNHNRGRR